MSCKCGPSDDLGGRIDLQYAVKIVCGVIKPSSQPPNPLPPGRYSTAINVHNPSRCDVTTLRWKVAIGLPGLRVGPVSEFAEASLGPDDALEIDCSDVMALLKASGIKLPAYVKGWVIIESPAELDVVAVYGTSTNRDAAAEPVNTFHTERVEPRCLTVCDDFVLDISTGVADWYVKGPAAGAVFVQATLSPPDPVSPWANPPGGSMWVVPGTLRTEGNYTYRLSFKLCSGFRTPDLGLNLLADDYANVFLNGHQLPPVQTGGVNFTTPINFSTNSHFKAGDNELIIVVYNKRETPTGLALHGSIEIANGRCPGVAYPLLQCPGVCYSLYSRTFYANPFIGFFIDMNQAVEGPGCNGSTIGDTGGSRRSEKFGASLTGSITPGTSIEYRVFTRNLMGGLIGWSSWNSAGLAGTIGADDPMTALEIRLVNAPVNCHVAYRVATRPRLAKWDPNVTWSPWFNDGATAGTTAGIGWPTRYPPIVAVEVQIV